MVRLGDFENGEVNIRRIDSHFTHPEYQVGRGYFDLAIIKVKSAIFSQTVGPICTPTEIDYKAAMYTNKKVTVAGWGAFDGSKYASKTLQTADFVVYSQR